MGDMFSAAYAQAQPLLTVFVFIFGACVGSFLNVCIYRIPRDLSVVKPRSFCPGCRKQIPWYHNIPLLTWVGLKGKSACCGTKISVRYFIVELLVGALFVLAWLKFDPTGGPRPLGLSPVADWRLMPVYWLVFSGLVLGTFVDFEHLIIPDRVTLGGIVAGIALSALVPSLHGETTVLRSLLWSSVGAAIGGGSLWLTAVIGSLIFRKEAMGFGDVKLLGAIGAFLGSRAILFTIVCSSFLGSIVGLSLVALGRKEMQGKIPYGPYLSLAAVLWILWGPVFWQWYLRLLAPSAAAYM